jgi:PKD repeat protein
VHADGEIWAQIMWELRTAMQDKYGDATGKAKHERLIILGMKATPDTPSFADARNGYLAADYLQNPTGTIGVGQDYCRLWKVFADNKLGTGSNDDDNTSTPTTSTDTPAACSPNASIAPVADTPEGSDITFDSSASTVGGDPSDSLSYAWDLDNDGAYDDSTAASPKWAYGDNGSHTVGLQVTNSSGYTDTTSISFNTTNVAPTVTIDLSDLAGMQEGDTRTVDATFSDPGWLDSYQGNVDLGTTYRDDVTPAVSVTTEGGKGSGDAGGATSDQGTATAEVTYGDNGTYTVTVDITDDDGAVGSDDADATVANVVPTATIDGSGEQVYDGVSAFILKSGEDLTIPVSSEDPGSDDLTFLWDWDGLLNGETPDQETSLVDPPGTDPALSPSVEPRGVDLSKTHAYGDACLYNLGVSVTDDDGGVGTDSAVVLVTGNATASKGHGWWLNEYRTKAPNDFTPAQLQCYLDIVNYLSMVFSEDTSALTRAEATKILNAPAKAPEAVIFDQMALGAWLNFANGSIRLDSPVDSNGDGIADSTFGAVMFTAETIRLDPTSTTAQVKAQKTIVERISLQSGP